MSSKRVLLVFGFQKKLIYKYAKTTDVTTTKARTHPNNMIVGRKNLAYADVNAESFRNSVMEYLFSKPMKAVGAAAVRFTFKVVSSSVREDLTRLASRADQ